MAAAGEPSMAARITLAGCPFTAALRLACPFLAAPLPPTATNTGLAAAVAAASAAVARAGRRRFRAGQPEDTPRGYLARPVTMIMGHRDRIWSSLTHDHGKTRVRSPAACT